MTGDDWLAVVAFAGVIALVILFDLLRRREVRRADRELAEFERRQIRREARRQP